MKSATLRIFFACALLAGVVPAQIEDGLLDRDLRLGRLFQPVAAKGRPYVARVLDSDGDIIALGMVVHPNGQIITKASLLEGETSVQLDDGRKLPARLVATADEWDLALLSVEAKGLKAAPLTASKKLAVGQWMVSPGFLKRPLGVGVLSVLPRRISKVGGFLGISFEAVRSGGVRVLEVEPGSGAAQAGLKKDDLILLAQGEELGETVDLRDTIRDVGPGGQLQLLVKRDAEQLELTATLGVRATPRSRTGRTRRRSQRYARVSERRTGFPKVFQHDTIVSPSRCGGPVLGARGEVLGMNIARSGRTQTLAIPTAELARVVKRLLPKNLP